MSLVWILILLLVGAVVAWVSSRWHPQLPRYVSLLTLAGQFVYLLFVWIKFLHPAKALGDSAMLKEVNVAWIPQFGVHFHLGLDGLSLLLIALTSFLGFMAVLASWKEIQTRVGFFHFNLLLILAALTGAFLALDLFLFYVFWEVMLVPLYFLIAIWGHERRIYASIKFFLFTQGSGLLMLLSIIGLYFAHGQLSGVYSFDYMDQLSLAGSNTIAPTLALWLMLGFAAAFAVKLPAVPLHTWLPDAHTEAPTAGSVVLAGLVLKVGAYGFLRFLVPLFPREFILIAPYAMALGVIGIIYGAVVAMGQTDLKRLVAYTSVSHMGFVLLGVASWNQLALQGTVIIMLAHGIATGALFILVGELQRRMGTRELDRMGGLWAVMPRLGAAGMVFALASLGLPAFGNFVGEFLVLLGAFRANPPFAVLASLGFVVSSIYSLWMLQRVFFGANSNAWKLPDASIRETAIMATFVGAIVWLGLFPQTVLETSRDAMSALRGNASPADVLSPVDPVEAAASADVVRHADGSLRDNASLGDRGGAS